MGRTVMDEGRELAVVDALPPERRHTPQIGILRPLVDADEARRAIAQYEELKSAIVRPDDIQVIQGRDFLKKSFWRRVAACFGLSLELVREERMPGNDLAYRVVYRAIAPNGRAMEGDGYCSTAESGRGSWPEHNVRATAHTRAKNRAISDLVGGGEVSAEEMPDDAEGITHRTPQRGKTTAAAAKPSPSPTRERLEAMQRRLIALDANYADPQQFKLWTLDVLGMTEQQLRARALNSGELVALENYLLDMEQAAAGTAFPPEKTPGELAREQAQQPAQPAATPDLADLPMARGGRH